MDREADVVVVGFGGGGSALSIVSSVGSCSTNDALSADGFKAETPYTIMFGPDHCGETNKVHFILRHRNPLSGEWEEKLLGGLGVFLKGSGVRTNGINLGPFLKKSR